MKRSSVFTYVRNSVFIFLLFGFIVSKKYSRSAMETAMEPIPAQHTVQSRYDITKSHKQEQNGNAEERAKVRIIRAISHSAQWSTCTSWRDVLIWSPAHMHFFCMTQHKWEARIYLFFWWYIFIGPTVELEEMLEKVLGTKCPSLKWKVRVIWISQ